jgi:hypothetical protein
LFVWKSYAAPFISATTIGSQLAGANETLFHFGAVMKDHSQSDNENPYSPLMCVLLLLVAGIAVKTGAAIQVAAGLGM